MIAFLTLCYGGVIWLLFFKLKLLPWNRVSQVGAVTIGVVATGLLVIWMNLFQPFCPSATFVARTVAMVPEVSGPILEVTAEVQRPLKKGDVIFRIDPTLYQADVDRLEAELADAEQRVPQLEATWKSAVARKESLAIELERLEQAVRTQAVSQQVVDQTRFQLEAAESDAERARLEYTSEIGGVNTSVASIRAQLTAANYSLEKCVYRAPGDGYVAQLFVQPGVRAVNLPLSPVGTFVYGTKRLAAVFPPNALRYVKVGDPVEVVLDSFPGAVHQGEVIELMSITGEGQLLPAGTLRESTSFMRRGQLLVTVGVSTDFGPHDPPIGTGGSVAIYTDRMQPIRIIRKVVMRIQAWTRYLPTGDRGAAGCQ